MLEILTLVYLGKSIKRMTTEKGLKSWKYILLMVLLWFGMEILGGIVGVMVLGMENMGYLLFAYGFAALGGYISYLVAKNAAAVHTAPEGILDAGMNDNQ